ncbi:hypothetical protein D3C87_1329550 [compost metagenome]
MVHAHFAHAAAQGAEFAIPGGRRCVEQRDHRLSARADGAREGIEVPVVSAQFDQVIGERSQVDGATGEAEGGITATDVHHRNRTGAHWLRTTGFKVDGVVAGGVAGYGQGIDLTGFEVVVHEERTAGARQRSHVQFEEVAGVTELDGTAIHVEVLHRAVTHHHPARVAVDAQVPHVLQATGQGRGFFQQYIGRAAAVRDDIAGEGAVANPQVTFRAAAHIHQDAVAGVKRRTIEDRNIGLGRAST